MSVPSRQFLVTQAVLNATAKRMPTVTREDGAASAIRWMSYPWKGAPHWPHTRFLADIHAEFHKLAQKYEAQI